jgi:hypothetical protein
MKMKDLDLQKHSLFLHVIYYDKKQSQWNKKINI